MRSIVIACTALFVPLPCKAAPEQKAVVLYAGWASTDITPDRPVALIGQLHKRISQKVRDPSTATALALETRTEDGRRKQALLISCDLPYVRKPIQDRLRQAVKGGGYSADKYVIGPKGGQVLVDETVKQLSALWN